MSAETLARWQFGITTVYHYFFVPITIALSLLVAVIQTIWVRTGDEKFLRLTKFFGKLFLINFAMGVVTGIVQEFQFGMNWSEYSRFVGDIFGAPLALEALLAFFLESVFIGLWIFGWDRLPKKVHLAMIWLAAIGTMLSAIFILAANSWMQNPLGAHYNATTDRAEMTSLLAVLTNPVALVTLPHVLTAAYLTAGGLILGVAGWHLAKIGKPETEKQVKDAAAYRWATKFGAWVLLAAGVGSIITGDIQGKIMTEVQPMKMAAAEALWTTEQPASFSILTIGSLDGKSEVWSWKVPYVLSFLATGDPNGKVYGINDLVKKMESEAFTNSDVQLQKEVSDRLAKVGVTDWVPNLPVTYWSFRLMMGLGFLAMAIGLWALWATRKDNVPKAGPLWTAAMFAAPLAPLFGNSFGWIFTEMGRQPFIVYGVLPTAAASSPGVSAFEVGLSMVLYTVIYGALAVVEVGLLMHYIKLGLPDVVEPQVLTDDDAPLTFAY
ncbi:MAG: cytochrome ubiquinol oxidase subunit I [Propionicimonas sp.]|uniref:cytochrome ubiquinol oxidase subunit I n=1 Tax=Propionicimonas sp. TaxID=1955623 RepID=UPI003D0D4316